MREKFSIADVVIYFLLGVFALSIFFAFEHLLSLSFSPSYVATKGGLHLLPVDATLDNYKKVLESKYIWNGYKNTLIRTVIGTSLQLMITSMGAYSLSKRFFPHRSLWTFIIVFTMFFSGGLIPTYILVVNLGLMDSYAAMILPGLVSAFNLVIIRNYFMSLPEEVEESCMIDGAGRFRIFSRSFYRCPSPSLQPSPCGWPWTTGTRGSTC
ncbi:MAG: carbohydrate ABC transporter permease [Bacillota bacterium]